MSRSYWTNSCSVVRKHLHINYCLLIKRIHVSLLTTHFASYAYTDRDTLETSASFFSACPTSGKPGSSLPQFSMSLRVVPSGRGWWGPVVHNVCFSLRLPLYSAAPAWLWRVAKLWGVVRASGGACMLPQNCFKHLTSFPHDSRPDINHFPGLADYKGMLGKMLLWIIRLIAINSVKWCANDWGYCFSTPCFCKG